MRTRALAEVRADADAVVAHDDLDQVLRCEYLHLERPLRALVGVHDDVLAGLRDSRGEVVCRERVEPQARGDAAEDVTDDRQASLVARQPQDHVRCRLVRTHGVR